MFDALTLDQMRAFVTVADAGSFRAGADQLSRTQSAVSYAVANLEAALCVSLFDRSGYRPALTPEGRSLLEEARAVLLRVDRMRARASGFGEGVELELSIVVDSLFPLDVAATALCAFRKIFPAVGVRLAVAPLGEPISAICEGRSDLSITVSDEFRDPRTDYEVLLSLPFIAVAASNHPLANSAKGEVTGTELSEHLQIVLMDPTELSSGKDFGVLSSQTWRVGSQDAKRALILAGVGWGRLPRWSIDRELKDGSLVQVPAKSLGHVGETVETAFLVRRIDRPLGPAARALRDAFFAAAPGLGRKT